MTKSLLDGADLKLGLFSANCSSGLAVTTIEERWPATWDDNLRLGAARRRVGIDFMLPIARWIGYGGETNFHEGVLDPVALAAGLLAETERLVVFATIHTAFNHPLVAAKRWRRSTRSAAAAPGSTSSPAGTSRSTTRWASTCRRITTTVTPTPRSGGRSSSASGRSRAATTIDGRFWQLEGVESMPKPYDGLLPILNAGSSTQGRDFAARNSNVVFTVVGGPDDGAEVVRRSRRTPARRTGARSVSSHPPTASAVRRARRPRSTTAGTRRRTPTGTPSTT